MIPSLISIEDAISFKAFVLKENCLDDKCPSAENLQAIISLWEELRAKIYPKAAAEQNQLMFLCFLEEAGVDNWECYLEAQRMLNKYKKEKSNASHS